MTLARRLATWARELKRDVIALWIAARDARTPWHATMFAAAVAAYALSPIDLIPDVIPIVGYLDDLVIVPLGIAIAVRSIPAWLMREFRQAATRLDHRPVSRIAALVVVAVWLGGALTGTLWWVATTQDSDLMSINDQRPIDVDRTWPRATGRLPQA